MTFGGGITIEYFFLFFLGLKRPFFTKNSKKLFSNLDFDLMNIAAEFLLEANDFKSFSKLHCDVNTHICDVRKAIWEQRGEIWVFSIEADRFLRNMVRSIIGTILEIGQLKISIIELIDIINKSDRIYAGPSVPAHGLFLTKVEYPENIFVK